MTMLIKPLSVVLEMDIIRSQKNHIKKVCRRPSCKKCQMVLEPDNCWWKCPKCGDVQAVDTAKPLFWNYCSNIINANGDYCKYPTLMTQDMEGQTHVCQKCSFMRVLYINQNWVRA